MKRIFGLFLISIAVISNSFGQSACISEVSNTSFNFVDIVWLDDAPGTCSDDPSDGDYTGSLNLNLKAGADLVFTADLFVTGDFTLTNSGVSTVTIPVGVTVEITGDFGDDTNNSVTYIVNGTLIVGGVFSGKNNNGFSGSGNIDAGEIDFGANTTCPGGCPTITTETCNVTTPADFCTNNVAPIDLIYFTAESENSTITLNWATASEDNFKHFVLERSADAYEFYPIVNVQAMGGLEQFQEYTFIDEAPLSDLNYYRLKAIDHDGTSEYHPIIGVMFNGELKQKILVYPNPVTQGKITVRLNFEFQKGIIKISDLSGRSILTEDQLYPSQSFRLSRKVKAGLYLVQFYSDQGSYVQKIIVR